MSFDERIYLQIADQFSAAALEPNRWRDALDSLARATGSERGELVGVGSGARPFNWLTEIAEREWSEFLAITSASPLANYRVAAAMQSAPMSVVHEVHYDAVNASDGDRDYIDFCYRWRMPFGCQTTLMAEPGFMIGLSVLRSEADGRTTEEQRAIFANLRVHARIAVKTQIALEQEGSLLYGGAETMSSATFLLDRHGRVSGMSPAAQAFLGSQAALLLTGGRLVAHWSPDDNRLQAAISQVLDTASQLKPVAPVVVLHPPSRGADPVVLEVFRAPPAEWSFGYQPRAMVIVRRPDRAARAVARTLIENMGLTEGEADIAEQISRGLSREQVARNRAVSVNTVRVQLKSIFRKLQVSRETELAARIGRLR